MGHAEGCACLSEERRSEIWQTDWTGHAEGHACLSEKGQSEIQRTDRAGHAEGCACLSAERRSEIRQTNQTGHVTCTSVRGATCREWRPSSQFIIVESFLFYKPIGAAPWGKFFLGRGDWAFWYVWVLVTLRGLWISEKKETSAS